MTDQHSHFLLRPGEKNCHNLPYKQQHSHRKAKNIRHQQQRETICRLRFKRNPLFRVGYDCFPYSLQNHLKCFVHYPSLYLLRATREEQQQHSTRRSLSIVLLATNSPRRYSPEIPLVPSFTSHTYLLDARHSIRFSTNTRGETVITKSSSSIKNNNHHHHGRTDPLFVRQTRQDV